MRDWEEDCHRDTSNLPPKEYQQIDHPETQSMKLAPLYTYADVGKFWLDLKSPQDPINNVKVLSPSYEMTP